MVAKKRPRKKVAEAEISDKYKGIPVMTPVNPHKKGIKPYPHVKGDNDNKRIYVVSDKKKKKPTKKKSG